MEPREQFEPRNPYEPRGQFSIRESFTPEAEVVSVKEWLITMLILIIPIVNLVLMFVWAFGSNTNPSKANFFKAYLILFAVGLAIWVIFFGTMVATMIGSV